MKTDYSSLTAAPTPKVCKCGSDKTQLETGRWYCRACERAKRQERDKPRRIAAGLSPYPKPQPRNDGGPRVCKNGHVKHRDPKGHYVCLKCHEESRKRREAAAREARGLPPQAASQRSRSKPSGQFCKHGHEKGLTPAGTLVCQTCRNIYKRGRAKLMRDKLCPHIEQPGFESLRAKDGAVVCVACLIASANKTADCSRMQASD